MNAIKALAVGNSAFMPKILVVGGGGNQGVLESLGVTADGQARHEHSRHWFCYSHDRQA